MIFTEDIFDYIVKTTNISLNKKNKPLTCRKEILLYFTALIGMGLKKYQIIKIIGKKLINSFIVSIYLRV